MNVQLKKVLHLSMFQDSEGILHTPNFFLLTAKEVETVGNSSIYLIDFMSSSEDTQEQLSSFTNIK